MDPFTSWTTDLARRGFGVLPASHAVPVELWAVPPGDPRSVLHLRARGTRVLLRRYAASDLATLLLRSACDCAEHRTAGADARTVLVPGAVPVAEVAYDGAARHGWRSHEAGLMTVATATLVFDELLALLPAAHPDVRAARVAGAAVA
ncbi:MAG: hypothetical protein ACTHKG_12830 [Nocardioides sp.]